MNEKEILKAEQFYNLKFPNSYKIFLMSDLYKKEWVNWNDYSERNVSIINKLLSFPIESIISDFKINDFKRMKELDLFKQPGYDIPKNKEHMIEMILDKYKKAPKPIPIYGHRYTFENCNSVYSIWGSDIICYGKNIEVYLDNEFGKGKIDTSGCEMVEFWEDFL